MWGREEQGKNGVSGCLSGGKEESTYLSSLAVSVQAEYLHKGVLSLSLWRNP